MAVCWITALTDNLPYSTKHWQSEVGFSHPGKHSNVGGKSFLHEITWQLGHLSLYLVTCVQTTRNW